MNPRVRTAIVATGVVVVALALLVWLSDRVQPELVTVKTGEVVVCTAGEVVEDNTEDIEVPASEVAQYSVKMRVVTCPDHQDVSGLYNEAQKAMADGDLVTASQKLRQVVAANAAYKKASEQLAQIESGKKPKPDTAPGAREQTATPTPDEPTDAVSNLTKYVPDRIKGFSAQGIVADPASITRNYLPTSGGADLLVVMAEQTVDAKSAASAIKTLRGTYPYSAATVSVGGKKGYFGVREQSAVVLVADGPVVVTVEMHAKKGSGSALKGAVQDVAAAVFGRLRV